MNDKCGWGGCWEYEWWWDWLLGMGIGLGLWRGRGVWLWGHTSGGAGLGIGVAVGGLVVAGCCGEAVGREKYGDICANEEKAVTLRSVWQSAAK